MNRYRFAQLFFVLIAVAAIVGPSTIAAATCPSGPQPPCSPARFTGSAKAHAATCVTPPPKCTPRGSSGARGPRGLPGPAGKAGKTGATGRTGAAGPAGPTGSMGAVGPAGTAGPSGPTGAVGATGSTGPIGLTGAAGANGTNALGEYAYIYNLGAETVPIESDITFDTNGPITPGITHAPGSTNINITNAGVYKITFSVSGTEPNQMAMFDNGALIAGTIYASGAGTQQNVGQALVVMSAGDVLTIRNHSSASAVGLATPIGGTQASTNASVTIEKVA